MIIYKFREVDRVFAGAVEVPDSPILPPFHTLVPPPEKEGFHAVMQNGWVLVKGPTPPEPTLGPAPGPDYAGMVRAERNAKLAATDWTQLFDAPVDRQAWAVYRQALRDVPEQEGFPHTIEWPTQP